jgi:hypothetical protein
MRLISQVAVYVYQLYILYYEFLVQKSVKQMPLTENSSCAKQQELDSVEILCHHFKKNL